VVDLAKCRNAKLWDVVFQGQTWYNWNQGAGITMSVKKIDVAQEAAKLSHPFQMIELGYVDDFAVSVFICQGAIDWHRHFDEDELFLVQSGVITLETEWGNTRLRPDEMAVAPKGVAHRSSSFLWSTVLLFRPQVMSQRKNGDRRIAGPSEGKSLHKVSVARAVKQLTDPFKPVNLATVDDAIMRLQLVLGTSTWQCHSLHDRLFLVFEREMTIDTEQGEVLLTAGEMAIVPKGMLHRLTASERAAVLLFGKKALGSAGR
jgi:mannose-6-phosphate isomerase-like protein (cupin superfamily)